MYVYRDEERTVELYAKDAHKEDKDTKFYCPNPDCKAHMFICGLDGSSSAYFRATHKENSHIKGCDFGSSNNFKPGDHDELAFDFEKAIESMLIPSKSVKKADTPNPHKTGTPTKKPLRTIRQIYDMCKSYRCSDTYNNVKIGQMLLDNRSAYMYPKGVFGYRLIEAKVKPGYFYDNNDKTITLCTPIKTKQYQLQLRFTERALFVKMRDKLFNNKNKIILVSGDWKPSKTFNIFYTTITSTKQYHVI